MNINSKGIQLIKSFEGCLLNAYLDSVRVPTIGYGATFYQNGTKVKIGDRITQEQANELLEYHIVEFSERIKRMIKSGLNDNQFSALVSFAFNVGTGEGAKKGGLKNSTLLRKVNINPNDATIAEEFMKYNKAGGKILSGLTRRRKAESQLYFS